MVLTLKYRPMGTNPLRLSLVIMRSTYGQSISAKSMGKWGYIHG